jgi:acyl carrier protein
MSGQVDAVRIVAVVKDFLKERFDISPEAVTDEVTVRELGLDSILMLDVMLEAEDRLDLKLQDLALPPNPKFKDVIALILRNMTGA